MEKKNFNALLGVCVCVCVYVFCVCVCVCVCMCVCAHHVMGYFVEIFTVTNIYIYKSPIYTQLINMYKIGLLYCKNGQSLEEEMYNNGIFVCLSVHVYVFIVYMCMHMCMHAICIYTSVRWCVCVCLCACLLCMCVCMR